MKDNVVAKTGNKEGLCEDPQTQTTEDVLWSELLLSEFPEVVKSNQYKENYNWEENGYCSRQKQWIVAQFSSSEIPHNVYISALLSSD